MRLKNLTKYGIPDIIIEAWTRRQGDYLLPLQEKAIRQGLLADEDNKKPSNLLISAPTSSGKSFCGEMAAIGSLLKRRKAVMLLPLKSIAEEKYLHFKKCYRDVGIKTILVTGDHPENDLDFEFGNFDFALVIYEKFNRLLTVNIDILRQIGLVIVDELQMIGDNHRGSSLEMALTKTIFSGYDSRIVALSAVLQDELELADWLKCQMVRETVRPVDLLQGIVTDGYFHFKSFNSGLEGREKFPLVDSGDGLTESLIEYLKKDDGRKLIFLKSRRDTVQAAFKLATASGWKEAKATLADLDDEENSYLVRSLKQVVSHGVAFHNADLTPRQRQAIENGYRNGEIKVIFSTTTLAMGVNLPAETVFLETMKYCSGEFGGKPQLTPITTAEFQNISGRAGRFGFGKTGQPGRAMVLAESDFEYEVLWSGYIDNSLREKVKSSLGGYNIKDIILDLIASGLVTDKNSLESVIQGTLYSRQSNTFDRVNLEDAIAELVALGLIRGDLFPTAVGMATAGSGILVNSCGYYLKQLKERTPETLIGWIILALGSENFDIARAGLTSYEYRGRIYEKLYHQKFTDYMSDITPCFPNELGKEPLDFRFVAILKAAFLLSDWADGQPVEKLERWYRLHLGQITDLAETAAWLLASIRGLVEAGDYRSNLPALLDEYSFNVQFGINHKMRQMFETFGLILNRDDYKRLAENGILLPTDLMSLNKDELAKIISSDQKIKNLQNKIDNIKQEEKTDMNRISMPEVQGGINAAHMPASELALRPSVIELDGRYERERYLVKIDGLPIHLTGKSFKYLMRLVYSRLVAGDGWVYKDDIEIGFNQARYLYRLKQEMNRDGNISWSIFENNRLGYYRLDLDPSKIKVNLGNLLNHPDYEVREMAGELSPHTTN